MPDRHPYTVRRLCSGDDIAIIAGTIALLQSEWPDCRVMACEEVLSGIVGGTAGTSVPKVHAAINQDGDIVGAALWALSPMADDIFDLCWAVTRPDCRRQGVNAAMLAHRLDHIARAAAEAGMIRHHVMVRTWDNPLYRSHGFEPIGAPFIDGKHILFASFETPGRHPV